MQHRAFVLACLFIVFIVFSAQAATLTATFTWADVPDETSYTVERQDNGGAWVSQGSLAANTTSFVQVLTPGLGVSYCFRVGAVNAIGTTVSDPICATPNVPTKPGSLGLTFVYTP